MNYSKLTNKEFANSLQDAESKQSKTTDWLIKSISQEQLDKERIQALKEQIEYLEAENERLKGENIALNRRAIPSSGHILKVGNALLFAENEKDYNITINKIKAEAYKEAFEKVEERLAVHSFTSNSTEYTDGVFDCLEWVDSKIEELEKELVGE